MRVISQNNNCDIPYESTVIVCNMEYVIARIDGLDYTIGEYSSIEKALKVLDMIEKTYLSYASIKSEFYGTHGIYQLPKVFKMPADDEVEV